MLQVTWLVLANNSATLGRRHTPLKLVYDIGGWLLIARQNWKELKYDNFYCNRRPLNEPRNFQYFAHETLHHQLPKWRKRIETLTHTFSPKDSTFIGLEKYVALTLTIPLWWQTIFRTQAQHLCFIHDSIWFIWFDTRYYLSVKFIMWIVKQKIENKRNL